MSTAEQSSAQSAAGQTVTKAPEDSLPMALDGLGPEIIAIDVIHKREGVTPFLDRARALGCRTFDGHVMLNGQAEELAHFFAGAAKR